MLLQLNNKEPQKLYNKFPAYASVGWDSSASFLQDTYGSLLVVAEEKKDRCKHTPGAQIRHGHNVTSDPRMLGKTNLMAKTKVKGTEIHPALDEAIEGGRAKNCGQQCNLAQQRNAGGDIRIYW